MTKAGDWIEERLHTGLCTAYEAREVLFEERTEQQTLVILDNPQFGRMMMLDGITQVTERDEFVYHEMIAHVPLMAHGNARNVLIIGGGDGGTAREVLRHPGVERVLMVEIDRSVVDLCTELLPMISRGAFDDPRFELKITDGAAFVRETEDKFDVIIIDSTDPVGAGIVLFEEGFYAAAKNCLKDGGVVITQNGVPFVQPGEVRGPFAGFTRQFPYAALYLATVPTYTCGPMAFGFGTEDGDLLSVSEAELERRFKALEIDTNYYTPAVHKGAFALPPYVGRLLSGA